jgi:hypothetical protein
VAKVFNFYGLFALREQSKRRPAWRFRMLQSLREIVKRLKSFIITVSRYLCLKHGMQGELNILLREICQENILTWVYDKKVGVLDKF